MSYTRNFGFRRTVNIVREARSKVPAGGTPYRIGTAVVEDASNPGRLTRPADSAEPTPNSGIVLFEHIQKQGVDPFLSTPYDDPFRDVPLDQYAQRVHGNGVKVWFRNTEDRTLYDGSVLDGDELVDLTDVAVNDYLTPAADGTWKKAAGAATGWMQVTHIDVDAGLVEAVLTF